MFSLRTTKNKIKMSVDMYTTTKCCVRHPYSVCSTYAFYKYRRNKLHYETGPAFLWYCGLKLEHVFWFFNNSEYRPSII